MRPNSYAMSVKLPDKNIDLTHTTCLTYKCRQLVHWHIDGQQALFQFSIGVLSPSHENFSGKCPVVAMFISSWTLGI